MDENFSIKKRKTQENEIVKSSNIPLYLGAVALIMSGATAFFLYQEMKKMKTNAGDIRKVKNQLLNIDSKLEDNSIQLNKLIHMMNTPISQVKMGKKDPTLVLDTKEEDDIEGYESEDSVLSYEED